MFSVHSIRTNEDQLLLAGSETSDNNILADHEGRPCFPYTDRGYGNIGKEVGGMDASGPS